MLDLIVSVPDHCLSFYFEHYIIIKIFNSQTKEQPIFTNAAQKISFPSIKLRPSITEYKKEDTTCPSAV